MSAKINQPSPQIFTSDPLEQIFGKSVMDPTMGGLAYMFMNALGDRRRMDQDTYMKGVSESNQIAGRVAQQELAAKQQEQMVTAAIKLAEMGQSGDTMPVLGAIIKSGALNQGTDLNRRLIDSKITANNRDPSGGGALQVSADVGPAGSGFTTIKGKGPNAQAAVNEAVRRQLEQNKGVPVDPNAPAALARRKYGEGIPN